MDLVQLERHIEECKRIFVSLHDEGDLTEVLNRQNSLAGVNRVSEQGLIASLLAQVVVLEVVGQKLTWSVYAEELVSEELSTDLRQCDLCSYFFILSLQRLLQLLCILALQVSKRHIKKLK